MSAVTIEHPGLDWIRLASDLAEIPLEFSDTTTALARLTQLARGVLGSSACTLVRTDLRRGRLINVACDGDDQDFIISMIGRGVDLGEGRTIDAAIVTSRSIVEKYDLPERGQGVASREIARKYHLRSVLCYPLLKPDGELIGYFNHFSSSNEPFSPATRQLVELFARQAVTAIALIEWRQTFERSVSGLNALSKNLLITGEDFFTQLAGSARELLSVPVCIIWRRAEQEQKLQIVATSGDVDEEFRRIELDLDSPGIKRAVATRDVKWQADVRVPSRMYNHSQEAAERGWVSLLTVPLMVGDDLLGMLDVYTSSRQTFETWEREFFGAFANYAALAIFSFSSRGRLRKVNDLMEAMTAARTRDELLQLFLRGVLDLVGATRGWVSLLNPANGELEMTLPAGNPEHRRTLAPGEGIAGTAMTDGTPVNVGDVTEPPWDKIYVQFWSDTRSEVAIPIMIRNAEVREGRKIRLGAKTIGVLNVESSRPYAFASNMVDILSSLAQHAAIAVERLEVDARLAELRSFENELGQIDGFDNAAETVLTAVKSALGYDYVNMSLVNRETNHIKTEYITGLSDEEKEDFKRMADHSLDSTDIQAYIVREGVPEVPAHMVPSDAPYTLDGAIFNKFRHDRFTRIYVPMRLPHNNRVVGTLEAGYNQRYQRFIFQRDVNMLQGFADYAAMTLEHKKLFSPNFQFAAVLREGLAAVGANQGSLMILNNTNDILEVVERRGPPFAPRTVRLAVGQGIAGIAVISRLPQRVGDVLKNKDFVHPAKGEPTFRSILVVPIVHNGRGIGAICAHADTADRFTVDDEIRLGEVARSIAPAIELLGLDAFLGHARRTREIDRFLGVAEQLGRLTLEPDKLREEIVKAAESVLEANPVVLYEYNADTSFMEPMPTVSRDLRAPGAMRYDLPHDSAPYRIVTTGQSHYADRARKDKIMDLASSGERPGGGFIEREGIVSSAGILLKAGARPVGVLFLNYRSPRRFSEHERHVIAGFAADAALALLEAQRVRDAIRRKNQYALRANRSVMVHRVAAPLTSMSRRLELIRKMSTGRSQSLKLIAEASRLNRHIHSLIAEFNAVEGRPNYRHQRRRVTRAELETLLQTTLDENTLRTDTQAVVVMSNPMPDLHVDVNGLEDDFINFLHDSERHAPGPTMVRVDGELASAEDLAACHLPPVETFVKLRYRDNGPGILREKKEAIFEGRLKDAMGMGLGLRIAWNNARAAGGALRECGLPGEGVVFEMYLPADDRRGAR
jgi:GAF domain-containing protein